MQEPKYLIGLDVHKRSVTYAVRDRLGNIVAEGRTSRNYYDLYDHLSSYLDSAEIAMEASTSYYTLYQEFRKNGYDIKVANSIQLRQLITKNDKMDARRLADMMRFGTLPCSFIPEEELRHLRDQVRMRHSLVEERTRWKNRIQALIDREGLVMPPYGPFTKTWTSALQRYLATPEASFELGHSFDHYTLIVRHLTYLETEMISYTLEYWGEEYELAQTVPGIGRVLACYVIANVVPIERFVTRKGKRSLRRYAGVVPVSKDSGESVTSGFIPKGSSRRLFRWALVEAANTVSRMDNRLVKFYKLKKKQKGCAAKAKIALAHKLSDILYHVFTTKRPYCSA